MPVRLEHIQSPSADDLNDLEKIRRETAPEGFCLTATGLAEFLAAGGWILAGRFNDRIVGVVLAQQENNRIRLSQAGVRAITQRRGVMHQMLHHICRFADEQQQSLTIQDCPAELTAALERRHFQRIDNIFNYNAQ